MHRYRLKIEVTQEDIDAGIPNDSGSCPIAIAIKRTMELPYVAVHAQSANIGGLGRYILPDHATQFVWRFDNERTVQPITFTMHAMEEDD